MALPSGYKRLEYIQSNGTQYIDTGYCPSYNTRVVMDVQLSTYSASRSPFGCRNANSTTASAAYLVMQTGANTIRSDYFGSSGTLTLSVATNQRLTIDMNKNVLTVNGQSMTNTAKTSGTSPYSLMLFTYSNSGSAGSKTSMTLYSCKIYDGTALIHSYTPCSNASGTVGLWDEVSGAFHGDAAGGAFTAGPVVDPMTPHDGHNTNIGNIAREIESGTALIGGVSLEIESGVVLVGGVSREIALKKNTFTVAVSGVALNEYCKTTLNGSVLPIGAIEVEPGTEIVCAVKDGSGVGAAMVYLNSKVAQSGYTVSYRHVVESDTVFYIQHTLVGENSRGTIYIVTGKEVAQGTHTINIGSINGPSVTINGTKYTGAATVKVETGTVIALTGTMTIDGISYSPDSGNPSLTVIGDVTITPNGWGKMTVTTG
jgi:hypothetical protein